MTADQLEARIKAEFPEGSEATTIITLVDKIGMRHGPMSDVQPQELDPSRWNAFARDPRLNGKRDRIKKVISAEINGRRDSWYFESIKIVANFYLDENQRLVAPVVIGFPDDVTVGF